MHKKAISSIFVLCLLAFGPAPAAAGVPDWLRNLAQQSARQYADDVNAVILLDEGETTVKDNGEIITHQKIAYRILRPEGKSYAGLGLPFDNETRITFLRGWSIGRTLWNKPPASPTTSSIPMTGGRTRRSSTCGATSTTGRSSWSAGRTRRRCSRRRSCHARIPRRSHSGESSSAAISRGES